MKAADYNTVVQNHILEAQFPLEFRSEDAKFLGEKIKNRQSIVLVGMKRVGISSFLRFFLTHDQVVSEYVGTGSHIFIPVDLNDLVEVEIFPFWILTLKRIVDVAESLNLSESDKKSIHTLFLDSIQTQDLFLTIDSVRKALLILCDSGFLPTIFFLRFDRMQNTATTQMFANLQGLTAAMHNRLSYVFTSVRSLETLSPKVFQKAAVSAFVQTYYFCPAKHSDVLIASRAYCGRYNLSLDVKLEKSLIEYVDGYSQYLQFALVFMNENKNFITERKALFDLLVQDERIALQSEELWESLTEEEQTALLRVEKKGNLTTAERKAAEYLWDTGMVNSKNEIFSPLFEFFLEEKNRETKGMGNKIEYTKKEYLLLNLLEQNKDSVCEREFIIETVWPEVEGQGVSDWAIDRLVARVRSKLKKQKSKEKIVTVKTRGYKLIRV